jgi:hypothetical protein
LGRRRDATRISKPRLRSGAVLGLEIVGEDAEYRSPQTSCGTGRSIGIPPNERLTGFQDLRSYFTEVVGYCGVLPLQRFLGPMQANFAERKIVCFRLESDNRCEEFIIPLIEATKKLHQLSRTLDKTYLTREHLMCNVSNLNVK